MDNKDFTSLLEAHTQDEVLRYQDIKEQIRILNENVECLLNTLHQAKGILLFLKWLIGISGSLTALFVFFKDHLK